MFLPLVVLINSHSASSNSRVLHSTKVLFGSCSKPYLAQPLWPMILSRNPDIWIWGGDIVYHDRPNISCIGALYDYLNPFNDSVDDFHCIRMGFGAMKPYDFNHNFELQLKNNGYKQLLTNNKTKIIGIWDDHDFGQNNGCSTNKWKQEAKDALMKFLNISQNDAMRNRNGIYSFHTFTFNKKKLIIDIYLLDNRWFADSEKNILLGDAQWKWLIKKMKQRTSLLKQKNRQNMNSISLFVSGIPMLPFYRIGETWASKSNIDRVKLMDLILNNDISNPIIISGDVHYGEIQRYNCKFKTDLENTGNKFKSLYEITSSGLTHSWSYSYPKYLLFLKTIAHYFSGDGATIGVVNDLNFGEIDLIYDDSSIKHIYMRIYGVENVLFEIDLMEDKYQNINEIGQHIIDTHIHDTRQNIANQEWICIGYNEPNQWLSKLYFINSIFLVFIALSPIIFIVTGGFGFCCYFFCCRKFRHKRKEKQS